MTLLAGIKQWWEKFSGRFKRLNRVDGVSRERLMSVNDLQYSELLPTSPVFTLGFTHAARVASPGVNNPSFLDLSPNFNYNNNRRHSFHAAGNNDNSSNILALNNTDHLHSSVLKTRKLLHHSKSPGSSLDKVKLKINILSRF